MQISQLKLKMVSLSSLKNPKEKLSLLFIVVRNRSNCGVTVCPEFICRGLKSLIKLVMIKVQRSPANAVHLQNEYKLKNGDLVVVVANLKTAAIE